MAILLKDDFPRHKYGPASRGPSSGGGLDERRQEERRAAY
jgi:hypothetical protein